MVSKTPPYVQAPSYVDGSGAIVAGDVSQLVFAAEPYSSYFLFQNISDTDMWINFGTAAVKDQPSIKIIAGGYYEPLIPSGEAVYVICATIGKKFVAKRAA